LAASPTSDGSPQGIFYHDSILPVIIYLYKIQHQTETSTIKILNTQKSNVVRVYNALEILADGLKGDAKRLTNISPEYRLRVGNYRVLFEIENDSRIVVYRVCHRKDAYKKRK